MPPPGLVVDVRTVVEVEDVDVPDVDVVVDVLLVLVDLQVSDSTESFEHSPSDDRQQPWYPDFFCSVPVPTQRATRLLHTESRQPRRQMAMAQRSLVQRSLQRL